MELFGDPVHLIQVELNICIRIPRRILKEVSDFVFLKSLSVIVYVRIGCFQMSYFLTAHQVTFIYL